MSDFPIVPIHRARKQIVPLGGLYDGERPFEMMVCEILLSKNFGPFYDKSIFSGDMIAEPGILFLTLSEYDTEEPGFLHVLIRSKEGYCNYWFSISGQ